MAIGPGKKLKATGVVKKVFPKKPDPYGFLLLLTPIELRGQEASFFCCDINIPERDVAHLRVGMQLQFNLIDKPVDNMKSKVDYKAIEMEPLSPSLYQAAVIREPTSSGTLLQVALDLTLEQVKISPDSYLALKLEKPLHLGDSCVVKLTWDEMLKASEEKRPLKGEIVSAHRLRMPSQSEHLESTETMKTIPLNEDSPPLKIIHDYREAKPAVKKVEEPCIIKGADYDTTSPSGSSSGVASGSSCEEEYYYDDVKQQQQHHKTLLDFYREGAPRYCMAACCQEQSQMMPKFQPPPCQMMNFPCQCSRFLGARNYPITPPWCPSPAPMDFRGPSQPNSDGC